MNSCPTQAGTAGTSGALLATSFIGSALTSSASNCLDQRNSCQLVRKLAAHHHTGNSPVS